MIVINGTTYTITSVLDDRVVVIVTIGDELQMITMPHTYKRRVTWNRLRCAYHVKGKDEDKLGESERGGEGERGGRHRERGREWGERGGREGRRGIEREEEGGREIKRGEREGEIESERDRKREIARD